MKARSKYGRLYDIERLAGKLVQDDLLVNYQQVPNLCDLQRRMLMICHLGIYLNRIRV